MSHILLVADRQTMLNALHPAVASEVGKVSIATNEAAALRLARDTRPDVVVLDATSRRLDAAALSRDLLEAMTVPLIAIVPVPEAMATIAATHFLVGSHRRREVRARLADALREPRELRVGPLRLNLHTRSLQAPHLAQPELLPPKLFTLLRLLMLHEGRVLCRHQLMAEVWETEFVADTRTLDVHIHWLRKRIEPDPGKPSYVRTARKKGYYLGLANTP